MRAVDPTLAVLMTLGLALLIGTSRRGDKLVTPKGSTKLRRGDVLTLFGNRAAVAKSRLKLSSAD